MKTKQLVRIALMAAVLCVLAPWKIPVGPIPITLASFGVYLAAGVLGPLEGTVAVVIYVLLGAVGVPVFSGFTGGAGCLLGVTGGYRVALFQEQRHRCPQDLLLGHQTV